MNPEPRLTLVTFWSLDLTSTIAGVMVYVIACVLLLTVYFKVLPWMDGEPKFVSRTDSLHRVWYHLIPRKKHFRVRLWFEAIIMVIILTDALSILIYPPMWKVGLANALFVFRQIPNGAHSSSYFLVFVTVILGFFKWNDALKGAIYGGQMVFRHEALWFVPYYITNWGALNIPLDVAFFVWILSMELIAHFKYHIKISKTGMLMYAGFLLSWFSLGFPITVKNVSHQFFMTPFYGVFTAEANEVVSWMVMFAVFVIPLFLDKKGWKVRDILPWN